MTWSRYSDEAATTVDQQSAVLSAAYKRRVAEHSGIQSWRIDDAVASQDVVHRQFIVHRSTWDQSHYSQLLIIIVINAKSFNPYFIIQILTGADGNIEK